MSPTPLLAVAERVVSAPTLAGALADAAVRNALDLTGPGAVRPFVVHGLVARGRTVLAVTAPFTVDESHALLRALGAALYLVGTFGVTIAINVPMNVQLESADAGSAEGGEVWHRYLRRWTAWNTLRTILGAAASALLVTSLV